MCGIAGIIAQNRESIYAINNALSHRGPDQEGYYDNKTLELSLSHKRLAILDISSGMQPFYSQNKQYVLVFNGEIYNHKELRKELEKKGHNFISAHSDTEVLLHSYMEWEESCLTKFNGMFAFALLDIRKQTLFLARDRFGEKPLFYSTSSNGIAFASEIQALKNWTGFNGDLDMQSIQKYFAYNYFPGKCTPYKNCYSLEAGCAMNINLATKSIRKWKYWDFQLAPNYSLTHKNETNLIEELREKIINAVKLRIDCDVPFGVFLSGGIDSSCILAAMEKIIDVDKINAFTIGFNEKSFDESSYASEVANFFKVNHYIDMLDINKAFTILNKILHKIDPLGDPSILPMSLLAEFTRKHVTVALSGDAGDELFAGYDPFKALKPALRYSKFIPKQVHEFLRQTFGYIPPSDKNMSLEFKIKRTLRGLSYNQNTWLPVWQSALEPREITEYFQNPLTPDELYSEAIGTWNKNAHLDIGDQALAFYSEHYLPNDILFKVDRATMLHSLESRAVFLDNEIVDFAMKLPYNFKIFQGTSKYILKKALETWLPKSIIERKKKGFGIPINSWLREFPITIGEISSGINVLKVEQALKDHKQLKGDHRLFLYAYLALQNHITPK